MFDAFIRQAKTKEKESDLRSKNTTPDADKHGQRPVTQVVSHEAKGAKVISAGCEFNRLNRR